MSENRAGASRTAGLAGNALIRVAVPASVGLYFLAGIVWLALELRAGFYRLGEMGFGDSYILYDVLHFEKTGVIYRNLSGPPYLPGIYSPCVYILYSLSRYFRFSNVFLGPRLIAFATFLACLAMVAAIAKTLIPVRFAWLWAVLLAATIQSMNAWIVQLRGDFIGIFFGLSSIRLLMSRYRHAALAAGLCAGMAIQIKLTLLAAAASGFLWLLMRRQWRDAGLFAAGASITSIGLFFVFWLREPNILPQMTAVMPGLKDFSGSLSSFLGALSEPVALLSLAALPLLASRIPPIAGQWPGWSLLLLYAGASLGLGFMSDMQAGGNINYFFEALLALTPAAVTGVFELCRRSQRPGIALFVAGVVVMTFLVPIGRAMYHRKAELKLNAVKEENRRFRNLELALKGRSIFSIDPRIALIDPHPALMEPFLFSYLRRMGRFDASPIVQSISAGEFDVLVSLPDLATTEYRGIRHFEGADVEKAVLVAYKPYCTMLGDVIELPRSASRDTGISEALRLAGCAVLNGGNGQP